MELHSCMLGSTMFGLFMDRNVNVKRYVQNEAVVFIHFISHLECSLCTQNRMPNPKTNSNPSSMAGMLAAAATSLGCAAAFGTNPATLIAAFFAFEACVGLYFPSMGTLRSQYVSALRGSQ